MRGDVRRERGEITCLVRVLHVPEARSNKTSGKDFFYRLPSPGISKNGKETGAVRGWWVPWTGNRL